MQTAFFSLKKNLELNQVLPEIRSIPTAGLVLHVTNIECNLHRMLQQEEPVLLRAFYQPWFVDGSAATDITFLCVQSCIYVWTITQSSTPSVETALLIICGSVPTIFNRYL
ncbi:hypothetical protein ILYODFUR_033706 [Ilyodon furcidens]|uniref:Uncharacterized protein n=1 Tax=Ilyodon furcidens TaxID=33524 RepID=A0ABV0UZL1_9TELE